MTFAKIREINLAIPTGLALTSISTVEKYYVVVEGRKIVDKFTKRNIIQTICI